MPKTIRNQFDKYLTYENLIKAHELSKKSKTRKREIILFELKKEEYIMWLLEQLKTGAYKHGGYRTFTITIPKERIVQASGYIDRIVHRWVVDNFLKPYFETQFINTTYACIKNRGMHKATLDVQKAMKHCDIIWGEYYILKMDVTKYFQNINKNILFQILQRKIKDVKLLSLMKKIIFSTEGSIGLPIGNYTSQTLANIYLNEVDQYAKHTLKCKYYFRYMDDTIILLKTKEEAKKCLKMIESFLDEKLKLKLNSKTQIFKTKQGVNFCGYKINAYRLKIRDKGKQNLKLKLKMLENQIKDGRLTTKQAQKYLSGHLGYLKIASVKNLEEKLFVT
ncbi:MAG: group II intron reverse transcriptase domain-containing protein [Clostridia bacterium]|nr:group II intron reverse transcriptase domain-containing protein [Clostridia bacterium]